MTTARIVRGLDLAAWRDLQPRSALHDEAWLSVMSSRLPGEVFTVTLGEDLGFCAVLVSDPDAYEAYNPYAVLWREPPVFALPGRAWRAAGLPDHDGVGVTRVVGRLGWLPARVAAPAPSGHSPPGTASPGGRPRRTAARRRRTFRGHPGRPVRVAAPLRPARR